MFLLTSEPLTLSKFIGHKGMRYDRDERGLYKRLWDTEQKNHFSIKGLIRALVNSPEYLNGSSKTGPSVKPKHVPTFHPHDLARR